MTPNAALLLSSVFLAFSAVPIAAQPPAPAIDPALYQVKEYRLIGPSRGGRATSVTGVPGRPFTFYMGTSGGGLWKTNDAGTSWVNVSDGFFAAGSIGAVAVAPSDRNVVYAGTGEACLRGDVSPPPIRGACTWWRKRRMAADVATGVHLFASEDVYRYRDYNVYFTLAAKPEEPPLLELLDAEGAVIRAFTKDDGVPHEAGMNRFAMAVQYPEAETVDGAIWSTESFGPPVPPGTYRVRLKVGDVVRERTFAVKPDPRVTATADDYRTQFDLAMATRGQIERAFAGVRRLRTARAQLTALAARLADREELAATAHALAERLTAIEDRLTQTRYQAYLDVCDHPPRIDSLMVYNLNAVYSADARPTDGSRQLHDDLEPRLAAILGELDAVLGGELAAFERALREAGVPYVDAD